MKKLLFITMLLMVGIAGFSQIQTLSKYFVNGTERIATYSIDIDTMHIYASDKIIAGSLYVPDYATDSCILKGVAYTVDGIAADSIIIPPGYPPINFGFGYGYIDSVTIESRNETWIILLPNKR